MVFQKLFDCTTATSLNYIVDLNFLSLTFNENDYYTSAREWSASGDVACSYFVVFTQRSPCGVTPNLYIIII